LPDGDRQGCCRSWQKEILMKLILIPLGVILLVLAGVYFFVPADQLPSFLPGHEAGLTRVHTKHGIGVAIAGLVLIAAGWWLQRR
jgi:uncharacterized membrane protein